ncbi:MAG: hypothetical protein PWP45_947 [Tepidanaerobacteraceae bacterium]|nr:hypothetical protein [Tepidanaerobacteraceae bacterium]
MKTPGNGGKEILDGNIFAAGLMKPQRTTTEEISLYIDKLLYEVKRRGEKYVDLVSGEIHKQLGLKNRMPQVCEVMYKRGMDLQRKKEEYGV